MRELNIKGFINEMSYDLTMQEMERIVVDYQDVILDYFVNNVYNYKTRREFNEVCEVIRSKKYMMSLAGLINSGDSRIKFDMAFVLYTATHHIEDKELAHNAFVLGYQLRELELGMNITGHKETDVAILISSVKTVRDYQVTPFFRAKEVENILENLPEVLFNAYSKKYAVTSVSENVISTILTKAVPDLQPEELVTACCKACMDKDMDERYKPYASRIQSFLYKVCGLLSPDKFEKALSAACNSIVKFNERTGKNETLINKYLNYKLLEAVVNSKDAKVPNMMKQAYNQMNKFKNENPKFKHLF